MRFNIKIPAATIQFYSIRWAAIVNWKMSFELNYEIAFNSVWLGHSYHFYMCTLARSTFLAFNALLMLIINSYIVIPHILLCVRLISWRICMRSNLQCIDIPFISLIMAIMATEQKTVELYDFRIDNSTFTENTATFLPPFLLELLYLNL